MNNPTPLCLDFNEALDMAQSPEIGRVLSKYKRYDHYELFTSTIIVTNLKGTMNFDLLKGGLIYYEVSMVFIGNVEIITVAFQLPAGGTVPKELLPNSLPENDGPSTTELKPDLVVIDRESNQVHIFVISIVDESEMADTRKSILENYYYLVRSF